MNWIYILIAIAGLAICGVLYYFYRKLSGNPGKRNSIEGAQYSIKPKYISDCEQRYYSIISRLLKDKPYVIFPQVPLSQIVLKEDRQYQGELNRVIDFCIFTSDYRPLLCIEINDSTHNRPERQERDAKVQTILAAAGLPLLTFWTSNGINSEGIEGAIREHLQF